MNIFFEWIFCILKKWIFFWMNILDFHKMNNFLNRYFGFSLPVSKMVVAKCLKLFWNHSGIISGTYFRGSITYAGTSGGLRSHILALFRNFEWFFSFLGNELFNWIGGIHTRGGLLPFPVNHEVPLHISVLYVFTERLHKCPHPYSHPLVTNFDDCLMTTL